MRIYRANERSKAERYAEKIGGDVRLDGIHGDMFVTESAEDTEKLRFQAAPEDIEERYPLLGRYFRS